MLENLMGPNALWLAEALSQVMDLQAGTQVLVMGCGKATSSIFLAREIQLQIWATDLWVNLIPHILDFSFQHVIYSFTRRNKRRSYGRKESI